VTGFTSVMRPFSSVIATWTSPNRVTTSLPVTVRLAFGFDVLGVGVALGVAVAVAVLVGTAAGWLALCGFFPPQPDRASTPRSA
jgi:uncharacterized oligopeptide transporter (OPT) family protein